MSEKEQTAETLPGAPSEHFDLAARTLATLRDEGQFLVFVSQSKTVRFIGDFKVLCERIRSNSKAQTIPEQQCRVALDEVTKFLQLCVSTGDSEKALGYLERAEYEDYFKKNKGDKGNEFRGVLKKKLDQASDLFLKGSLTQRLKRHATAVIPCVEDLDVEVVSQRKDELKEEGIQGPFLRLRLRYSETQQDGFPWFVFGNRNSSPKSFEIECDETDIDLLLRRLLAAKETLLRVTNEELKNQPKA